ncbi:hypothetical protein C7M84_016827, partial [Penaeus vannamei]
RTIYVVTSTYLRTNQVAEMVQLAQTLMLVPDVYWIVTEDTRLDNEFLLLDGDSVHIRSTRGVSVFPVGLAKDLQLSTPVVKEGRFSGWYDDFEGDLQFPVEFAGFAFSVELLLKEEGLLRGLGVPPEKMECKAELCTKVFVWHVESKIPNPVTRYLCDTRYDGTNLRVLEKQVVIEGKACYYGPPLQ